MSIRSRKLAGGLRWGYDKTIKGQRLFSPYIYLTKKSAQEAEEQAAHHYRTTGQVLEAPSISKPSSEPAAPQSTSDLFARWVAWLYLHRSPRHAKDMETLLARACLISPELAAKPALDLTPEDVETWGEAWCADLLERGRTPAEVNKFLRRGQTAFNAPWGRRRARPEIPENPFALVDRYSVERRAKYVPTPDEVAAIRLAAGQEYRLYLDLLTETGARVSEARSLAWQDVGPESVVLYTRKTARGDRVPRRLAIGPDLANSLASWRRTQGTGALNVFPQDEDPTKPRRSTWELKHQRRCCRLAGVTYFPPGCFRHYRASLWAAEGRPLTWIQARLGHSQATTTNNYLREIVGL